MAADPHDRRVVQEEIVHSPEGAETRMVETRTHIDPTPAERQLGTLYRAKQVVWFLFGTLVTLIGLRFFLLALGANTSSGFGAFLVRITQPFMAPFLPLFNEQQATIEFSALVAIVVYLLIAWGITKLLDIALRPPTPPMTY